MPVSSPSYFPPNRANGTIVGITAGETTTGARNFLAGKSAGKYLTQSDVIAIGDSALSAGTLAAPLNDANAQYSILIGSSAGASLSTWSGLRAGPSIIIGGNSWKSTTTGSSVIAIGTNIYPNATNAPGAIGGNYIGDSVLIGNGIGVNTPAGSYIAQDSVIIGNGGILQNQNAATGSPAQNVLVGFGVASQSIGDSAVGFFGNVIIGYNAGAHAVGTFDVLVGYNAGGSYAGSQVNGTGSVCVGANTSMGNPNANSTIVGYGVGMAGASSHNTLIGYGCQVSGAVGITMLGDQSLNAFNGVTFTAARLILIGRNAGTAADANIANKLIVETNDGVTRLACLYGDLANGNLVIGNSTTGTNRDMPGTNVLKLLSGTKTGTPVGGGMLYIDGANNTDMPLHWVNAAGADSSLGPSGPNFQATGLGVITPAQLTATVNDYAPAGFAQAQLLRVTPAAGGSTINGVAGGSAGRHIRIQNLSAVDSLTFNNLNAGSAAANQIATPGAAALGIVAQSSVELWYDANAGHWFVESWA